MDSSRNYVIDRVKSRHITVDDFNFDKLSAPPLSMFFTAQDLSQLNYIAKSVKLSGKLKTKLEMIDNICKSRGLVKFGSGTNRVVYRHPEFNKIVFKIAYDNAALKDNVNELKNQYILKPFVAKTFEVSPCGTVAISERVIPITSREEFIHISHYVLKLLDEYIIGKYIMADVGNNTFMNYGFREGFGPVLLDYSFLYELDENKIYCTKPDPTSPTGLCEGEIGYDDGFNELYCSKCGAKHNAIELKKKIKDNGIIVHRRKGEEKMRIKLKGGSLGLNTVVNSETGSNDNFMNTVQNIVKHNQEEEMQKPENVNRVKISLNNTASKNTDTKKESNLKLNINRPVVKKKSFVAEEPIAVNGVEIVEPKPVIKEEPVVEETSVEENTTEEVYTCPITIDESLIGATPTEKKDKGPVELIDEAVDTIIENLNNIKIDAVKDDAINRMISKIIEHIPANGNAFKQIVDIAVSIYENAEDDDYLDVVHSEKFIAFIKRVFEPTVVIEDVDIKDKGNADLKYHIDMQYSYDNTDVAFSTSSDTITCVDDLDHADNQNDYTGIEYVNGVIVNAKSIFNDASDEDIIVGLDENSNYITNKDGMILGINIINECEVNSVSVVSSEWVASVSNLLNPPVEEEDTTLENALKVSQIVEG